MLIFSPLHGCGAGGGVTSVYNANENSTFFPFQRIFMKNATAGLVFAIDHGARGVSSDTAATTRRKITHVDELYIYVK